MPRAARLSLPLIALLALALLGASMLAGAGPVEAQGWTCTYDFSIDNQGWTAGISGGPQASYSSGAWRSTDIYVWSAYRRSALIQLSVSSTTLTNVSVSATYTMGTYSATATTAYIGYNGMTQLRHEQTAPTFPYTWSGSQSGVTSVTVFVESSYVTSSAIYDGAVAITSVTLQGTGAQPTNCGGPTPTPSLTPTPSNTPTVTPTATPATQTIVYDFRTGQNGWVAANGYTAYSAGNGWISSGTYTTYQGAPQFADMTRRKNAISYCTENLVRVISVELLISVTGASYNYHQWSSLFANGSMAQGSAVYNQSTGADLTRTITLNQTFTESGMFMDLSTSDPNFSAVLATLSADVVASSYTIKQLTVVFATGMAPVPCESNYAPTVTLDCPADVTAGIVATFDADTTGVINSWEWDFGDGNTSTEADGSVDFSWPTTGTYTVEVSVFGPGGSASDSCEITSYRVGQPRPDGSGALYRPIHSSDTDPTYYDGLFSAASAWYDPDNPTAGDVTIQHTVIGFTQQTGANVYAVADGTVLDITPLDSLPNSERCQGVVPSSTISNVCRLAIYENDESSGVDTLWTAFSVSPVGMFRVRVSYVFGYLDYYVTDAPTYVREGQELLAGCIVGLTADLGYDSGAEDVNGLGGTWLRAVEADGDQWPILPQLYIDPGPGTACNAGGEYSDCLFDPLFTNQGGYRWQEQGGVSWSDGVTLEPGASISLDGLNLDATTSYSFTVWTERPRTYSDTDARVTLGIGTTETSFFLDESIRSPWTIAPATHTADQGSLYSIRIINSGRAPFTVLQNCVTAGEPNVAPGSCYFQNYTFDGQLTSWTTTGTIVPSPAGAGALVVMSDLATIGQNVTLYADGGGGDHEYTVRLEGVLNGVDDASMITVRYRYGGGGWVTPSVAGWTRSQQNFGATNRFYVLEFDVPSGTFAGLMEFQFDFTAAGSDVIGTTLGLNLLSLCLQDAGGFSHHPGGGGSGWTPGYGCDNSAPPAELQDDFGAWIAYHLDGMQDIYYCDVIPQLERLNNITYGIYEYAQWTGLYSQAAQTNLMTWADRSLFPWLGGHLSNIAMASGGGLVTDIGGGCHDIFCLLDSLLQLAIGPIVDIVGRIVDTILGLINTTIDLLLPLLEAVVHFFVMLITGITGILGSLINLITAFITGIANAQPAPVPGLPNCAIDPSSNAICAVMYGLEHTVFADEGAAIIPLFIAILSIVQLQWLIGKITELIGDVTERI